MQPPRSLSLLLAIVLSLLARPGLADAVLDWNDFALARVVRRGSSLRRAPGRWRWCTSRSSTRSTRSTAATRPTPSMGTLRPAPRPRPRRPLPLRTVLVRLLPDQLESIEAAYAAATAGVPAGESKFRRHRARRSGRQGVPRAQGRRRLGVAGELPATDPAGRLRPDHAAGELAVAARETWLLDDGRSSGPARRRLSAAQSGARLRGGEVPRRADERGADGRPDGGGAVLDDHRPAGLESGRAGARGVAAGVPGRERAALRPGRHGRVGRLSSRSSRPSTSTASGVRSRRSATATSTTTTRPGRTRVGCRCSRRRCIRSTPAPTASPPERLAEVLESEFGRARWRRSR